MSDVKLPLSRRHLDIAIERLAPRFGEAQRIRRAVANTIVAQLMPDCVIKGGSSLKFRYGDIATRVTKDMDAAQGADLDAFITRHPFDVKLEYNRKPWVTVRLEMGTNEVGDTLEADYALAPDIAEMFAALGLPQPKPVPLMKLNHQVAQKLHGLTDPSQSRPHDLVDLQLIFSRNELDLALVRKTCERLFSHRRRQSWPARVVVGELWDAGYAAAKYDLPVKATVAEAVDWANDLIDKISRA